MLLDGDRINKIEAQLQDEMKDLEKKWASDAELEECRDKLAALARIVTRNVAHLPTVRRKVFVSTPLIDGAPDPWVEEVLGLVNQSRENNHVGLYDWSYGPPEATEDRYEHTIEGIVESHYFLVIVPLPQDEFDNSDEFDHSEDFEFQEYLPHGVDSAVIETLGAACVLPKLILIAVERGVDATHIGKQLYGDARQRLTFDRNETDGRQIFANKLEAALEAAPMNQAKQIQERQRQLELLVG